MKGIGEKRGEEGRGSGRGKGTHELGVEFGEARLAVVVEDEDGVYHFGGEGGDQEGEGLR